MKHSLVRSMVEPLCNGRAKVLYSNIILCKYYFDFSMFEINESYGYYNIDFQDFVLFFLTIAKEFA